MTNLLIISLHASPNMAPGVSEWGGTHTYMKELLQEIDYEKFNVVLVTRKVFPIQKDIEQIGPKCKIINLSFGSLGDFDKRLISNYHENNFEQVKEILKQLCFKPDVIHSVYWNSGYLAFALSGYYKIHFVHSIISNAIGRDKRGAKDTASNRVATEQVVFDNAKYIICVGNSEKNDLINYYSIPANKIFVAGQSVHKAFLYPAHNETLCPRLGDINNISNKYALIRSDTIGENAFYGDRYAFTYTGRLHKNKGVHHIIAAWIKLYKKYKHDCPPLWLIGGDAADIESMRKEAHVDATLLNKAEKSGKLIWWGYLDECGLSTLYLKTLCLVTNSLYEPGGRVAVEALCEGVPVIASDNGFANEIIKDWYNGFIVGHGAINKLVRRMELFIKNPNLIDCMRENCLKSGNTTVRYWNFIGKHEYLYEATKNNKTIYPDEEPNYDDMQKTRVLRSYPFINAHTDEYAIKDMALQLFDKVDDCSIKNRTDIYDSSEIWEFAVDGTKYIVKTPLNRIEFNSFYDCFGILPKVSKNTERYLLERLAVKFNGVAPVVATVDSRLSIIRQLYCGNESNIKEVICDIENVYATNAFKGDFEQLNHLIENSKNIKAICEYYKKYCSQGLAETLNFSLRVETRRWYEEYKSLDKEIKEFISPAIDNNYNLLISAAKQEVELRPVLNLGGCDVKNLVYDNNKTMFVDLERVHWGWPGIDYADYLITYYKRHKESENFWEDILDNFTSDYISKPLLLCWLILNGWKEAISETIITEQPLKAELIVRQKKLTQLLQECC